MKIVSPVIRFDEYAADWICLTIHRNVFFMKPIKLHQFHVGARFSRDHANPHVLPKIKLRWISRLKPLLKALPAKYFPLLYTRKFLY